MSEEGIGFQIDLEGIKNDIQTIENLSCMLIDMENMPSESDFLTIMGVIRRTADEAHRKIEEPLQAYRQAKKDVENLLKRSGSKE